MKKLLLFLMICIYTTATFGIGVRSFYCCNKLKSNTLTIVPVTDKGCGMEKSMKGCCNTTYHFFKVKDKHIAADNTVVPDIANSILCWFDATITPKLNITYAKSTLTNPTHAPPFLHGVPIYLYYKVYRI